MGQSESVVRIVNNKIYCDQNSWDKNVHLFKKNYLHYSIIKTISIKNVTCEMIDFINKNEENEEFTQNTTYKEMKSHICLLYLQFTRMFTSKKIFEAVLNTFENFQIKFPVNIYLNFENKKINLFFNLLNEQEILLIEEQSINLLKYLNSILEFEQNFEYANFSKTNSPINVNKQINVNTEKNASTHIDQSDNINLDTRKKQTESIKRNNYLKFKFEVDVFKNPVNEIEPRNYNNSKTNYYNNLNKNNIYSNTNTQSLKLNFVTSQTQTKFPFLNISSHTTTDNQNKIFKSENSVSNLKEAEIDEICNIPRIKIKSKINQKLIGFFFEKYDYIDETEFFSYYLIGVNSSINDIIVRHHFEIEKKIPLQEIIRNPFEDESIIRLVFRKSDFLINDKLGISKMNRGYTINNKRTLILQIPFNKRLNPEDIYKKYQLSIELEKEIKFKQNLMRYIGDRFGEILEFTFIDDTQAILTFTCKNSIQMCLNKEEIQYIDSEYENGSEYDKTLKAQSIQTLKFSNHYIPLKIVGFNTLEDRYSDKSLGLDILSNYRPPVRPLPPYEYRNSYIPSLKYLLISKSIWNMFRIENDLFQILDVETFIQHFREKKFEKKKNCNIIEFLTEESENYHHKIFENQEVNVVDKVNITNKDNVVPVSNISKNKSIQESVKKEENENYESDKLDQEFHPKTTKTVSLEELEQLLNGSEKNLDALVEKEKKRNQNEKMLYLSTENKQPNRSKIKLKNSFNKNNNTESVKKKSYRPIINKSPRCNINKNDRNIKNNISNINNCLPGTNIISNVFNEVIREVDLENTNKSFDKKLLHKKRKTQEILYDDSLNFFDSRMPENDVHSKPKLKKLIRNKLKRKVEPIIMEDNEITDINYYNY